MSPDEAIGAAARRAMRCLAAARPDEPSIERTVALLEALSEEWRHAAGHLAAQGAGREAATPDASAHLHESLQTLAVAALCAYAASEEVEPVPPDVLDA